MYNFAENKVWMKLKQNEKFYGFYSKTIGALLRNRRLNDRVKEVQENGLGSIFEIEKALSNKGACFFVDNGTLLGFIREKRILKWDYDIDFGIYIDESFTWNELEATMREIGYYKKHQFRYKGDITEQTYVKDNIVIDFFCHFNIENATDFYVFYKKNNYVYEKKNQFHTYVLRTVRLSGTHILDVEGGQVHIPNEFEEYLAGLYGESWRIPNPDWVSGSGPACIKLDNEFGYYEKSEEIYKRCSSNEGNKSRR